MAYGFIVEGHLEADVVSHLCKGSHVRRLSMNGRDVALERMAEIIYPHVVFLLRKVECIFVVVDREQRAIEAEEMEQRLAAILAAKGIDLNKIIISVPDRNIESWIAPFVDDDCTLQARPCRRRSEGANAKSVIKAIFKNNNRNYVEVIDGVKYFKAIIPSELEKISKSFSRLYKNIDSNCWWRDREVQRMS